MSIARTLPVFILLVTFFGCTTTGRYYSGAKSYIKGEYYLNAKKYDSGLAALWQDLKESPYDPVLHYYIGRLLLNKDQNREALKHLKIASAAKPRNADYHFWLGLAYGSLNKKRAEAHTYQKALSLNKTHLQALTYMGHNLFERKRYTKALAYYKKALSVWPNNPAALYNRGLILKKLGRTPEEKRSWKQYLYSYMDAPLARYAVIHLNNMGDFDYRNFTIGRRVVSGPSIQFYNFSYQITDDSLSTLNRIAEILIRLKKRPKLHIVAYQKNNLLLAEKRAKSVKKYLLKNHSKLKSSDIRVSWFKTPEKITSRSKKTHLDASINLFTAR